MRASVVLRNYYGQHEWTTENEVHYNLQPPIAELDSADPAGSAVARAAARMKRDIQY